MLIASLAVALGLGGSASAQLYWANEEGDSVGRSSLDGLTVDQDFITGASDPRGVAVDGAHVYWAQGGSPGSIGRADLDGGNANQAFIATGDLPQAVAVDSTRVYWSQAAAGLGKIGRALLDGSGANQAFISTAAVPCGVAISADDVYWVNGGDPGSVGTAHINGADPDQDLVTGLASPCGVAVADGSLYWASEGSGTIGRANLDGSDADASFVTAPGACGVAVDETHVYWTSRSSDSIGRADIDGTDPDAEHITGALGPCGIAVSPTMEVSPSSGEFAEVPVGARSEILSVFVGNTSSSLLDVSDVSLAGADARDFEMTGDGCTLNVAAPLGGCVINVRFSPTVEGARGAVLRIVSNASDSPTEVALSGVGVPDVEPPRFLRARVRPRTFAVDPDGSAERARRTAALGTAFQYLLSEAARVRFTIKRRVGERLRRVGRFAQRGEAGENRRRFSGRIGSRSLDPGPYWVKLGARDAAGNRAEPIFRRFRVVR